MSTVYVGDLDVNATGAHLHASSLHVLLLLRHFL